MAEHRGKVRALRPLEADAQQTIVELAEWRRWWLYHTFDSRNSAAGFPDLTLVRDHRIVFAEIKRVGEKPRASQREVLDRLAGADGEVYLWTLDDLHEIGRVLERKWEFVPATATIGLGDTALQGPRLRDGNTIFAPRSAWIPGTGRRDAA